MITKLKELLNDLEKKIGSFFNGHFWEPASSATLEQDLETAETIVSRIEQMRISKPKKYDEKSLFADIEEELANKIKGIISKFISDTIEFNTGNIAQFMQGIIVAPLPAQNVVLTAMKTAIVAGLDGYKEAKEMYSFFVAGHNLLNPKTDVAGPSASPRDEEMEDPEGGDQDKAGDSGPAAGAGSGDQDKAGAGGPAGAGSGDQDKAGAGGPAAAGSGDQDKAGAGGPAGAGSGDQDKAGAGGPAAAGSGDQDKPAKKNVPVVDPAKGQSDKKGK